MAKIAALFAPLMSLFDRMDRANLDMCAAGIAFFGFLAIFPAVAAVIAIWGFASDPSVIRSQLVLLQDYLPLESYQLLSGQVEALLAANSRKLGWATLFSTMLALWSARAGVAALIRGINATHYLPNRIGPWHVLRALAMTLTLVGMILVAMVLAIVAPLAIGFLPLGPAAAQALELANVALGLLIVVFGIAIVYRLAPNRPRSVRRPMFTRGLFLAVVLWAVVSRGLVIYLANFGSYNQVYGSIGAVVALMMWLYLSAYAVLLGAAVDAERAANRAQALTGPVSNPSR